MYISPLSAGVQQLRTHSPSCVEPGASALAIVESKAPMSTAEPLSPPWSVTKKGGPGVGDTVGDLQSLEAREARGER